MDEVKLHPDRFKEERSPLSRERAAEMVDRWRADHFHGPHHLRAITDPYDYISRAAEELKRRLREDE